MNVPQYYLYQGQQIWGAMTEENASGLVNLGIPKEYINKSFMYCFSVFYIILPLFMIYNFTNTIREIYRQCTAKQQHKSDDFEEVKNEDGLDDIAGIDTKKKKKD